MTPTSKAEGVRERARKWLLDNFDLRWKWAGDQTISNEDRACLELAAFAESEAALARKEESEAILKIVRNSGVEAGTWGEEAVRDEIASEIRKRSQEEGR